MVRVFSGIGGAAGAGLGGSLVAAGAPEALSAAIPAV